MAREEETGSDEYNSSVDFHTFGVLTQFTSGKAKQTKLCYVVPCK